MNFIYVHTHDSGREMQPYGANANNPELMRLARESVMFRNAYCVTPTCSPSRSAMLTGMTSHQSGMLGLAHRGFSLNDYSQHLAPYLGKHGYYTALIGVQHEAKNANAIGYDEVLTKHIVKRIPPLENDKKTLALVLDFLESKRYGDKPFFLSFGMRSTHRVYEEADENMDGFVRPPHPIPDTPESRHDYLRYLKTLDTVDMCVGKLLDALDTLGLADDTAVMFTTDHGIAFPHMKCNLYDTGTGVALMFRIPGKKPFVSDALVSHVDVFPTVCDILGVPHPDWLRGKSLMPIINGEADEVNDYVFSEVTYHATYEPMRSVRSKNAKLIRLYDDDTAPRLSNIDVGGSKNAYLSSRLAYMQRPREMLFDLVGDPCERINLADNPEYADVYEELSRILDRHMKETDDPIIYGKVEMREGWIMNRTDAVDPDETTYDFRGEPVKEGKMLTDIGKIKPDMR